MKRFYIYLILAMFLQSCAPPLWITVPVTVCTLPVYVACSTVKMTASAVGSLLESEEEPKEEKNK